MTSLKTLAIAIFLLASVSHASEPDNCSWRLETAGYEPYIALFEHGLSENQIPLREALRVANSQTALAPMVFNGSPEEYAALKEALNASVTDLASNQNLWLKTSAQIQNLIQHKFAMEEESKQASNDTRTLVDPQVRLRVTMASRKGKVPRTRATLTQDGHVLWANLNSQADLIEVGIDNQKVVSFSDRYDWQEGLHYKVFVTKQNRLIIGILGTFSPLTPRFLKVFEIVNGQAKKIISYSAPNLMHDYLEFVEDSGGRITAFLRSHKDSEKTMRNIFVPEGKKIWNPFKSVTVIEQAEDRNNLVSLNGKSILAYHKPGRSEIVLQDLSNNQTLLTLNRASHREVSNFGRIKLTGMVDHLNHEWLALVSRHETGWSIALINLASKKIENFEVEDKSGSLKEEYVQLIENSDNVPTLIFNQRNETSFVHLLDQSQPLKKQPISGIEPSKIRGVFKIADTLLPIKNSKAGDLYVLVQGSYLYFLDKSLSIVHRIEDSQTNTGWIGTLTGRNTADGNTVILHAAFNQSRYDLIQVFSGIEKP